ncbi:MAG TPA: hypothetical protein DD666_10815 [Advenella kashmirensis]|uniref:Uncharacterized protein n=1 Tax=Advenella kashmirensis TaxID=310575 RepID=A0A356LFU4_9BURK|nr:hypothetical protein [Advenella kashmirensis]
MEKSVWPPTFSRGQRNQKYYSVYCLKSYYNIFPVTLISVEILLLYKPIELMFKFFDKKTP